MVEIWTGRIDCEKVDDFRRDVPGCEDDALEDGSIRDAFGDAEVAKFDPDGRVALEEDVLLR